MKRREFLLLPIVGLTAVLAGSKDGLSAGQGYIVTYSSTIENHEVEVTSVDLPN